MKKITELTELRWRTVHITDEYGNRRRDREEYIINRVVKSVASGPRFGHFIIDMIAYQIALSALGYLFEMIQNITNLNISLDLTFGFVFTMVLCLLYPILYALCEFIWQRTPGKFLTKTIVIDDYGNKPELRAIVLRSLIRIVPLEPFSCFDNYSRGWHDRWSNTWVVTDEELVTLKKLQAEHSETL